MKKVTGDPERMFWMTAYLRIVTDPWFGEAVQFKVTLVLPSTTATGVGAAGGAEGIPKTVALLELTDVEEWATR